MFVPRRSTLPGAIGRAAELARRSSDVHSKRMYEDLDNWNTIGVDTGFSFRTGWSLTAGYGDAQILLDPIGLCHLRGAALCNNGGGGVLIDMPTWGPVPSGAGSRFPVVLTVVTGSSPGTIGPFYVTVTDNTIRSPGTAGFGFGTVTSYRLEFGHTTWRRLV